MADERPVSIYALVDPRDESVRYIGQTVNPEGRLLNHNGYELSHWRKDAWLLDLRTAGLRPTLRVLRVVARAEAARAERLAIAQHLAMGCDLTNNPAALPAKVDDSRTVAIGGKVTGRVYNAMVDLAWAQGMSIGETMEQLVAEALAARAAAVPAPEPGEEGTS